MLRLLNKDRKRNGRLPALFMQEDLSKVARKHSRDMAKKDYFSHTNTKGLSPAERLKKARVTDAVSGENLAKIGGFALPTVRAEIGLMNSPGHRANILNKSYNCVGIGVVKSATRVYYYTQNFAKRELIFNKNPRSKTTLKKGIKLSGKTIANLKQIIIEIIHENGSQNTQYIPVKNKSFKKTIHFEKSGKHTLNFYVKQGKNHLRSNQFSITVKNHWWG